MFEAAMPARPNGLAPPRIRCAKPRWTCTYFHRYG